MRILKIRLRKPTRVFSCLAEEDLELKRHEHCIVKADKGLEFGTCILPGDICPEGYEDRFPNTIIRKATVSDETKLCQIQRDEERALELCAGKIRERELAMKLVDAEYSFDRNRIVFYFTAEDRVDFRELVRDLAGELKTRIELRHIQVRDEAKIVGGIGVCGRELCCATWLTEFKPISMKMAKRQNLSLNPSKISGQCGRLLCCLSYEHEMYKATRKSRDTAEQRAREARADGVSPEASPLAQQPPPADTESQPSGAGVATAQSGTPAIGPERQPEPGQKPKRRRRRRRKKPGGGEGGSSGGGNGNG